METARQLVKVWRVVKEKKTTDAVTKKKNILVESLKRKRSEPVTPCAKEQKENKTLKMKDRKEP